MPRFDGSTSFIRLPSMNRSPDVMLSSPAIIRSKVDLPQPEGPTYTHSSFALISRLTFSSTGVLP